MRSVESSRGFDSRGVYAFRANLQAESFNPSPPSHNPLSPELVRPGPPPFDARAPQRNTDPTLCNGPAFLCDISIEQANNQLTRRNTHAFPHHVNPKQEN